MKIYVAAVEALRKKERQDKTQFTTKIGSKTSLGPVIVFGEIFIPNYVFDANCAETDCSHPLITGLHR
jgi:hypothetical protein